VMEGHPYSQETTKTISFSNCHFERGGASSALKVLHKLGMY
jgi:hypothetical protein